MSAGTALIVGAGSGLSAALARAFTREGLKCVLAARRTDKLKALCDETGASAITCDSTQPDQVNALFAKLDTLCDAPKVVVYNASGRVRGPIGDLDPKAVADAIAVSGYGGFLVGQAAAKRMLKKGSGTILFTGASASIKGFAQSSAFAMGKFALRGLAQSMARELVAPVPASRQTVARRPHSGVRRLHAVPPSPSARRRRCGGTP